MAKNKKPRKQYRPRPALNPVGLVLNSMTLVTACERDTMSNESRLAFQALLEGRGTLHDWKTVTHTLNMAGVLPIQPMEFSMANKLDACQHTAIKYIARFRGKGGIQDLEKAKHVIDMLIEFETRAQAAKPVPAPSKRAR